MDCLKRGLIQWIDIFSLGVLFGGIVVGIANVVTKWVEVKTLVRAKKADLLLGRELLEIHQKLKTQDCPACKDILNENK